MSTLTLCSPDFENNGWMPEALSARGANRSPELRLSGLDARTAALAVTMEDESHPLVPNYCHWLMWNLPVTNVIPAALPAGAELPALGGARQGVGYGKHAYKGPKPPLHGIHRYNFTVYALDTALTIGANSGKAELLAAMEGHVLQSAVLCGKYQSRRNEK